METALFVDTFSRKIEVSTVSVTEVADTGLVLRYGAKVGNLWQLTEGAYKGVFHNNELPIILATRGYVAQSSEGFVQVVSDDLEGYFRGNPTRVATRVVGIQGFPWQTRKGLAVLANPMKVLVLRPGTNIAAIDTHARRNPEGWHSNKATAEAALAGIKLRAKIRQLSVFVTEGQSDYTQAWELAAERDAYAASFEPEFPPEHRAERFAKETRGRCAWARGTEDRQRRRGIGGGEVHIP